MKRLIIAFIMTILLFTACLGPSKRVLVAYYRAQYWATPWQELWFEENDMAMANWYEMSENQRLDIIESFVEEQLNVGVFEIHHYPLPPDMGVCAACGCPRGEHYELLIDERDLEFMRFNGFSLIEKEE